MLTCIREFPCFTAWGVRFLKGTYFNYDPGGLIFFAYGQGGRKYFYLLGVAHVKFSRFWKGVT